MVLLEKGFSLNTHLILWHHSWIFPFLTYTPHADCCVNVCTKPVTQMIESSIVMDSRARGVLPLVSSHAVAKMVINTLRTSVDYLTYCTCLFLNLSGTDTMCFKQLLIILCILNFARLTHRSPSPLIHSSNWLTSMALF